MGDEQGDAWWDGYHLGYRDGEGSMENIGPTAEKWHAIHDEGWQGAWQSARDQVLYLHKPTSIPPNPKATYPRELLGYDVCVECFQEWPCRSARIFLPDPIPNPLSPEENP